MRLPRKSTLLLAGTTLLAGVGIATAAPANAAPQAACTWRVTVLPSLSARPNQDINRVLGTDGQGLFAGVSAGHAVLWKSGTLIDLGEGEAFDVDHTGVAVGDVPAFGAPQPALWRAGGVVNLALPAGAGYGAATGINDAGLIVGWAGFYGQTDGTTHAVVWNATTPGVVRDLGTLGGDPLNATQLEGVDAGGAFAGSTLHQKTFEQQAVTGTVATGLRELPGTDPDAFVQAHGIAGRYAAGVQNYPDKPGTPLLWIDGKPTPLAGDPGGAALRAVNTAGTAVGESGLVWRLGQRPEQLPPPLSSGPNDDYEVSAFTIGEDGVVGGAAQGLNLPIVPVLWRCA